MKEVSFKTSIQNIGEFLKFFFVLRIKVARALVVDKSSKILSAPKTSGVVINNLISAEIFVPHCIKFSDSVTDIALAAAKPSGIHNGVDAFSFEKSFQAFWRVLISKFLRKYALHVAFGDCIRTVVPVRIAENNVIGFRDKSLFGLDIVWGLTEAVFGVVEVFRRDDRIELDLVEVSDLYFIAFLEEEVRGVLTKKPSKDWSKRGSPTTKSTFFALLSVKPVALVEILNF